jgi:AraC-like DNA-binding protein
MLYISHQQLQELMTSRPVVQEAELGYNLYHSTFESIIDEPYCKGSTKSIRIREGITFLQVEITFMQDTEVEMMSTSPQVGFGFCLKGPSTAYVKDLYNKKDADFAMHLSNCTSYIYANPSSSGHQHFWANKTLQGLYIHFSYESFKELITDSLHELPIDLQSTLNHSRGSYLFFGAMPKPVLALCYSLINNPFTSKSREFYTEAKVFELIAHQVDTLLTPSKESIMLSPPLTKIEEERIDYCYEQLQKDLNQPPSLLELAKGSGLSVYRMKNGFRQRYGDTPFRLLTEIRMIKAKELLEKGNQNVSEVAMEVGYSSLGTFSNAFFERFGLRPSSYKKI